MFELRKLGGMLIEPLVFSTCLIVVALLFAAFKRARLSMWCAVLGVCVLWLSSTPWLVQQVFTPLEHRYPPRSMAELKVQAERGRVVIVVLGGGHRTDCATSSNTSIPRPDERSQFAVALYRALPSDAVKKIVVSGDGRRESSCGRTEADAMAQWLRLFGVPESLIAREEASRTTQENARETLKLLAAQPITSRTIYLVTSADHMRRAVGEFELARRAHPPLRDVVVLPTPVSAETSLDSPLSWRSFVPNAHALYRTTRAVKEYVGLFELWSREQ
jgi:uncharacterized SAM-binding protein YcdF (DUF218 family)